MISHTMFSVASAQSGFNLYSLTYKSFDVVIPNDYFTYDLSVLQGCSAGSITASNDSENGIPLQIADIVEVIKTSPRDTSITQPLAHAETARLSVINGNLSTIQELGGLFIVVDRLIEPTLLLSDNSFVMSYGHFENTTRILVSPSLERDRTSLSFSGDILNIGDADITSVDLASPLGTPMSSQIIPSDYAIEQNYPNPFNPSTVIRFSLPSAGDYTLTFVNALGQTVHTVIGTANAGTVEYEWTPIGLASGMYLYRLEVAGRVLETRKALLLK